MNTRSRNSQPRNPNGKGRNRGFHRLPVEFNSTLFSHLEAVSKSIGASKAETLRRALLFYGES